MFKNLKIIKEDQLSLREESVEVKMPINQEDLSTLISLYQYVLKSQNKQIAEEFNLRPGVGLACPQIGINKRMFAIHAYDEDDILSLAIVNPKIISNNNKLTYLNDGEGCLSVDRDVEGLTPRYSKITVEGFVYDFEKKCFNKKKFMLKDYFAIVFQHEYDHLNGVLFVDNLITEDEAKKRNIPPVWEFEDEEEKNQC